MSAVHQDDSGTSGAGGEDLAGAEVDGLLLFGGEGLGVHVGRDEDLLGTGEAAALLQGEDAQAGPV